MKKLIVLTLLSALVTVPAAYAFGPGWEEKPIRIELLADKECYDSGEDVRIELQAANTTNKDITLAFSSSHQSDYSIDGKYLWSRGKGFTEALTRVEILAGKTYSWYFVHTSEEYSLSPGKHVITGMVVGCGHSQPVTIVVGSRKDVKVTVSTDEEVYAGDEEIPIHVTITNETESEIVLHFRSGREAGYSIDDRYVRYNASDALDVYSTITLEQGESHTWNFVHDPSDYLLAAGKHTIEGMVVNYGHSDPITIVIESGLEITVGTDATEYALDDDVHITVAATNYLLETITLKFEGDHQASYIIDGLYHRFAYRRTADARTELEIEPNETVTWEFTHTPDDYRLLPGEHSIVGVVIGYGKSEPAQIVVGEGEKLIDVSVSTDKEAYDPGDPVRIEVKGKNTSEEPVTLHFPSLHYADYQIDEEYLWSRGKFLLPIPTSFTIPPGVEVSWRFVHRTREYPLEPGEHSVVGIVVGYGRSEAVGFVVNEKQPEPMTVEGLLVKRENADGSIGDIGEFLLYTRQPELVYSLIPDEDVALGPHVNMTVEVSGEILPILAPVPGILFYVKSIRDILRVEVDTDNTEYYQQENIVVSVIARNMTDEVFTIYLHSVSDIIARLDCTIVPPQSPVHDFSLIPHVVATIPPRGTHEWKFIFKGREHPLSHGEHSVSGEILGYGKSKEGTIKIIEKPSEKIVAEGIVDTLASDVLCDSLLGVPRYVLVDRKTAERLYILRNPRIGFWQYLGQFVEVAGVPGDPINYPDVTGNVEEAIPELFVLRIRRLLAIAVSTDKTAYSSSETINVYVTARNCTPQKMTLSFDSDKQAYYSITPETDYVKPLEGVREVATNDVTIEPYGLHVWEFEHDSQGLADGTYSVLGGVCQYGQSKPVSISIVAEPPAIREANGIIERAWWAHWNWFSSSWYVLLDPERKEVSYFLTSDRVELDWYLGKYVKVTGYPLELAYPNWPLEGYDSSGWGDGDDWKRPIPPILPPWPLPEHLKVVSVLPLKEEPPPDENGNGLPDGWEIATGLDELGAGKEEDSDGDGVSNVREYFWGTDPLDPASVVKVKVDPELTGMVTLRWRTVAGRTYSVYCADGLSGGAFRWRRLVGGFEGTGTECSWTDDGAPDIAPSNTSGLNYRFYRVEVE